MAKKDKLTKKQKEELQKLTDELMELSTEIVEDYKLNPSKISGSTIQVNENSPYLDDTFKGKSWKKVIKGGVNTALETLRKKGLGKKKKK